ncbi:MULTISPECIES: VOC family protein [Nocardiopsis]|uniref:VOC family protein n=1 Tax=Nocardiopsis TaxID=2013 RepID=UPI00034623FE|nr:MULTISPECIES: VOC family protein [Nocardiopsis]
MITGIDLAVLYVRDQAATVDFYTRVLDFQKTTDAEMWPGARWVELTPPGGGTRITVHTASEFNRSPGEGAYLILACDDAAATARRLRERGATATEPVTEPWGTYIKVEDPDGGDIMIAEK